MALADADAVAVAVAVAVAAATAATWAACSRLSELKLPLVKFWNEGKGCFCSSLFMVDDIKSFSVVMVSWSELSQASQSNSEETSDFDVLYVIVEDTTTLPVLLEAVEAIGIEDAVLALAEAAHTVASTVNSVWYSLV